MVAKTNGTSTAAKPKSTDELLKDEIKARKVWYGRFNGGAPKKPYTKEATADLRALEKCKTALVASTGTANFKEAAAKLNYSPQYAPRTRVAAK